MSSKPSKKDRLQEKRDQQKKAREKKLDVGKSEVDPSMLSAQVEIIAKELVQLTKRINSFVNMATVAEDVVLVDYDHFRGPNSTYYTSEFKKLKQKEKQLYTQIETLKDKIDPSRIEKRRHIAVENEAKMQFWEGLLGPDREFSVPKKIYDSAYHNPGKYTITRKSVGIMMGKDDDGNLAGVRCYHYDENGNNETCDCTRENGEFKLSEKCQKLQQYGSLIIDDIILHQQKLLMQTCFDDSVQQLIPNPMSDLGKQLFEMSLSFD